MAYIFSLVRSSIVGGFMASAGKVLGAEHYMYSVLVILVYASTYLDL